MRWIWINRIQFGQYGPHPNFKFHINYQLTYIALRFGFVFGIWIWIRFAMDLDHPYPYYPGRYIRYILALSWPGRYSRIAISNFKVVHRDFECARNTPRTPPCRNHSVLTGKCGGAYLTAAERIGPFAPPADGSISNSLMAKHSHQFHSVRCVTLKFGIPNPTHQIPPNPTCHLYYSRPRRIRLQIVN